MENLVFTQLSISELRRLLREEIESVINIRQQRSEIRERDEIGGMQLAVEITGLAKATIYSLVSNRKLPHSKRRKRLYFSRKELTEWIAGGKRKTQAEIATEARNYTQNKSRVITATNDKSPANQ
jgi:predicted DNA-binding transcriptional regulator AlpA